MGCLQFLASAWTGIPYAVVGLATNDAALEYVQDLGYSQAPVVMVNEHDHWSGFNPDEIERLRLAIQ